MAIANEANSGGRHPAVLTSDANDADRPLSVVDVGAGAGSCGGAHSAVPALDSEILSAVRACNGYPKRGKDITQNVLAKRIAKKWLDLLPSTRKKLQELRKQTGLKPIWASNSGDKHPVVTMTQGSSEGGRGIKRRCEESHAEPNSGGEHLAVTKRKAHASCGDRRQAKRPSQEEHAHMPPRKRMPGVPLLCHTFAKLLTFLLC